MENLGYKEGSTKVKSAGKRRMSRPRGSIIETESLPLSMSPRYNEIQYIFNKPKMPYNICTCIDLKMLLLLW